MAYKLGILFGDLNNPFWQEQELWYRKYLPDFPFEAEIYHLHRTLDAAEQADLCSLLMRRSLDALIVNALDEDTLGRSAANVRSRTLIVDAGPKISPAVAGSIDHYLPVKVCDYQEQGRLCVQELLKQKLSLHRFCCIGGSQEPVRAAPASREPWQRWRACPVWKSGFCGAISAVKAGSRPWNRRLNGSLMPCFAPMI